MEENFEQAHELAVETDKITNAIQELFILNNFRANCCVAAMLTLSITQFKVNKIDNNNIEDFLGFVKLLWKVLENSEK